MNLITRLIILNVTCLLVSCATPYARNPWETPNRYIRIPVSEQAQFNAALQPCIEHARKTFDEANNRFRDGLPGGGVFYAIVYNDLKGSSYIEVDSSDSGEIRGYVNFGNRIKGENYAIGDHITLPQSDLIDWTITYHDRPADGNLLGKYILLKQDDLITADCDPADTALHHYRYFSVNYSFIPPGNDGWQLGDPGERRDMIMQERNKDRNEINTITSSRFGIPPTITNAQLIELIRKYGEYGSEEEARYKVVKLEADTYSKPGTHCVRAQHIVEDKKALQANTGKRGFMIRNVETLLCVHPAGEQIVVVLNYSHLHRPGKQDPEFSYKADKVFESLAFTTRYH